MYDASSRKDIRRAEKAARAAEVERINYLVAAMSTHQGRAWFHNLLEACHLFESNPSFNPHRDYFASGERNVGLQIFADILANCPDYYIQMMREANERRIEQSVRNNRSDSDPAALGELDRESDPGRDDQGQLDVDDNLVDYGDQT